MLRNLDLDKSKDINLIERVNKNKGFYLSGSFTNRKKLNPKHFNNTRRHDKTAVFVVTAARCTVK